MINTNDIRVAKILDIDKIVINKGSNHSIKDYMEFLVYKEGEEIYDPVSGESLGILENPKGTFKAIHVQDNMTVLLSKTRRPNNIIRGLQLFADLDPERALLDTIKEGDKVKIINQV